VEHRDYDFHGLLGLRLINATACDAAAVARQLGPSQKPLTREPDIVIRFVPQLSTTRLRCLGKNKAGYSGDGYFLLRHDKQRVKVRIPFEQIGNRCEMICESGVHSVPFLMDILNLTLLGKDCAPVHASAFIYQGTGVLVTGWADGGKTTALLAFASQGADYVGDDWVWLRGDGQAMYGLPGGLNLSAWHLKQWPRVQRRIGIRKRLFLQCVHGLDHLLDGLLVGVPGDNPFAKLPRKTLSVLKRQVELAVEPAAVFSPRAVKLAGRPEKVFLFTSQQGADLHCEPAPAQEMVQRMAASFKHEQLPFMEQYLAFRFAFPGRRNKCIENAHDTHQQILGRSLMGKEMYQVQHPYPVSFRSLFDLMRPFVEQGALRVASNGEGLCDDSLAGPDRHQSSMNA